MKKLGLVANCDKPRAGEVVRRLVTHAGALGLDVTADPATARLGQGLAAAPCPGLFDGVEAVVALGGDGTMLRVVRDLDGRDKPVMGVNIGGLGFLTSVAEDEMERALGCLARDDYRTGWRSIAECGVFRGTEPLGRYRALNEVVVATGTSSRVVRLDLWVDDAHVTSYVCDGLIVSTPTGSTGHSLSAGGPILSPETRAFVVSLICPHTLSSRPLVVPDGCTISVSAGAGDPAILSVDGRVGRPLAQGDTVKVKASSLGVRFIHLPGYSYFAVLRQKLQWAARMPERGA